MPFCKVITGGDVRGGNWDVALLGDEEEGKVQLGLGTVLVEARPCALEIAASPARLVR